MLEDYAECETILRRDDPDRAVATAFAPPDRRADLAALYAFDIETARIRQIVSQPLPGEIRLQWWRDRIAAHAADPLEAGGQGSPVAGALLRTIGSCGLPSAAFETLLDARIFDLYDDPMPDRAAFETYAGETASAVVMFAAMILDRGAAAQAAEAAGHAGVVRVVAEALRLYRRRPQHAQIFFPTDVLAATGCSRDELQAAGPAVSRALDAMAAYGREHLAAARHGVAALPRSLRPAFLELEQADAALAEFSRLRTGAAAPRTATIRRLFRFWRATRR